MRDARLRMQDRQCGISELFSVHGDDPPFAGKDDAETLTVSEQMFGFRGSLYKFPPRIRNPQFGDFVCSFVSWSVRTLRFARGGLLESGNVEMLRQ